MALSSIFHLPRKMTVVPGEDGARDLGTDSLREALGLDLFRLDDGIFPALLGTTNIQAKPPSQIQPDCEHFFPDFRTSLL
jgi:hypothetical protein